MCCELLFLKRSQFSEFGQIKTAYVISLFPADCVNLIRRSVALWDVVSVALTNGGKSVDVESVMGVSAWVR